MSIYDHPNFTSDIRTQFRALDTMTVGDQIDHLLNDIPQLRAIAADQDLAITVRQAADRRARKLQKASANQKS